MASQDLLVLKSLAVFCVLGLLFVAERLWPAVPTRQLATERAQTGLRRIGRNLSLWALNALISPLVVIPITLFAVTTHLSWREQLFAGGGSHWLMVVDILLLDLWIYWWHRANHKLKWLWRFHRVHHLDQWLDVTSAVRFHFGEVILSALARSLVIIVLGIPLLSVIVFEAMVLVVAGFHHSNLRLPARLERGLSQLIITPSIHWVHHHVLPRDTDSNYGTLLSLWDRIFASRSASNRTADMEIGLSNSADMGVVQLFVGPFKRR